MPSYKNQSIDMHIKSVDWFIYDGNFGFSWVNHAFNLKCWPYPNYGILLTHIYYMAMKMDLWSKFSLKVYHKNCNIMHLLLFFPLFTSLVYCWEVIGKLHYWKKELKLISTHFLPKFLIYDLWKHQNYDFGFETFLQ